MATEVEKAAVRAAGVPFWAFEAKADELDSLLALICNEALAAQAVLPMSAAKCRQADRITFRLSRSLSRFKQDIADIHVDASDFLRGMNQPVPLTGGGDKPDDDELPPEGGG